MPKRTKVSRSFWRNGKRAGVTFFTRREAKKIDECNIKELARKLYIQFGFKFYGDDGEDSWSHEWKEMKDGRWTGRWLSESGGDCGALNREAARKLWDTGRYKIDDYGGEDYNFTCTEKEKKKWYKKAEAML